MKEVEQVVFSTWAKMVSTIATDRGVTILHSLPFVEVDNFSGFCGVQSWPEKLS